MKNLGHTQHLTVTPGLLYSLIQTCKINKVNLRKYLTHVLNQAHAMRRGEVDPITLLPQFIDPEILE